MDVNQDNSGNCSVSDDDTSSIEQSLSTSAVTFGVGHDSKMAEDVRSQDSNEMASKELATDESNTASESEISKKDTGLCIGQMEFGKGTAEKSKFLAESPSKKGENEKNLEPKDENIRYERNLKKFLEDKAFLVKIRPDRDVKVTEKVIKSDGAIAKATDYKGKILKISSILSKVSLKRSSAPPTLSTQNLETEKRPVSSPGKNIGVTAKSDEIPSENSETPVSIGIVEIPLPRNDLDGSTPSKDFKAPIVPTCVKDTICDSPGTTKIIDSASTPVLRRPTDFNFKPRKAYYTFSPGGSGVLRQCRSLPNINRQQRREEKQRRSLILDDRSRIVRTLFSEEQEQSTPETRRYPIPRGATQHSEEVGSKDQILGTREKLPAAKETSDRRSSICRKLAFGSTGDKTTEVQASRSEGEKEKPDSPQKRKDISPQTVEDASVKKVRISSEFKKGEEDTGSEKMVNIRPAPEEDSEVFSSTGIKKPSPMKRKSLEADDDSSSSRKK